MIRTAIALLALLLTAQSAAARPGRVTCFTVREAVATFGIVAARQYAARYLTPAQIAWARRCLKKRGH